MPDPSHPSRFVLAIETSNPSVSAGVALGESDSDGAVRILGEEALRPVHRHDDDLMPAIDRLMNRHGASPGGLARIVVSIGPGGYTALRIAVATGKMIALTTGAELVGVPTTDVAAAGVEAGRPFGVALASKRDAAYIACYSARGEPIRAGAVCMAQELRDLPIEVFVADGHLPGSIADRARELGLERRALALDPSACLRVGMRRRPVPPASFAPLYGREPEAVTRWRERRTS